MKNPLIKRLPRELKSEIGKYLVIFLFLAGTIALVSGFLVANDSMSIAYDESFEKYNIEDGNFELENEAHQQLVDNLEQENTTIYDNFYKEEKTEEIDSTLRIFADREDIDKICLMSGNLPQTKSEIAIDRMYADNNDLNVGDSLTIDNKTMKITGLVALSDYSALFQNSSDMMFDSMKFGVAIMAADGFQNLSDTHLHYNYSWKYQNAPSDSTDAKEKSEDFLKTLVKEAMMNGNSVVNYIPEYTNQAIIFTGDDIKGDNSMMTVFLYLVIIIIAFIFAITISNTITKEANVIGTLRASGYTKGELVRHYMTMPVLVMLVAALVGNILGYTYFRKMMAGMYYGSYSLPTYVTRWNLDAFIKTTIIPIVIMAAITFFILTYKLSLSPLKFLRRDLRRKQKKKSFRLNSKIRILNRFRLRVIFQNMPNYVTIIIGIMFANVILLFGAALSPLLDHYQDEIVSNMLCEDQYILKTPQETSNQNAEKFSVESLKTLPGNYKTEDVTVYGIADHSQYIDLTFDDDQVYVSNAYAQKYGVKKGSNITLQEQYGDEEYTFIVAGVYYYPAGITVFMGKDAFDEKFDVSAEDYSGYFSNEELTDLDQTNIATQITKDDLTKTTRQLKNSMGSMTDMLLVFGVAMYMMIIYLLSKIIIEKNAQSISMTKILGYSNGEINGIYILTTSIVTIASLIITIIPVNYLMKYLMIAAMADYSGWLPYYVPMSSFIEMIVLGVVSYLIIAWMQTRKVKKIPLADALKNIE